MAKKPSDDLFEQSTMTFGEHLEELRVCLFRGIIGIALGCLVGFYVANNVVRFFQSPLERAMKEYYLNKAKQELPAIYEQTSEELDRLISDEEMVPEMLQVDAGRLADALRQAFPDQFRDLQAPDGLKLLSITTWRPVKVRFQVLNAQEAFMIWMKAAIMTGLVLGSPYALYQIWTFVAAGLYPHEKHYVHLYLPISIALFFAGASLAFLFVFDPVLNFLFTFNRGMNAEFDPRIGEWLSFVLILPIGFGLSFQLPLVMLFVNRLGLVSIDFYMQQWRIAILIICVISMVLTPADPISMILMAVPLCLLYLVGILMCLYMPRGRSPFEEAYEP